MSRADELRRMVWESILQRQKKPEKEEGELSDAEGKSKPASPSSSLTTIETNLEQNKNEEMPKIHTDDKPAENPPTLSNDVSTLTQELESGEILEPESRKIDDLQPVEIKSPEMRRKDRIRDRDSAPAERQIYFLFIKE